MELLARKPKSPMPQEPSLSGKFVFPVWRGAHGQAYYHSMANARFIFGLYSVFFFFNVINIKAWEKMEVFGVEDLYNVPYACELLPWSLDLCTISNTHACPGCCNHLGSE